MALLLSNYQPAKFSNPSFDKIFNDLIKDTKQLDIAIGYISEKSLDYLIDFIHKNGFPHCNLIIGMHYFEKFTRAQYAVAKEMEQFLKDNNLGSVKLVNSFPYHGKVYSFKDKHNHVKSIIGSSNLHNILPHKATIQYELDILIDDQHINNEIINFISKLKSISPNLSSENLNINSFKTSNNLMDGLAEVEKIESEEQIAGFKKTLRLDKAIKIPIKTYEEAPKSNINVYFGTGRQNTSTGIVKKRPWYEVELIVKKGITDLNHYPRKGSTINVFTDDGYQFECATSGDYNKNFRSAGDLKILGRWLKGRLENSGFLTIGEKVTENVLENYGRNHLTLIPNNDGSRWYLDFSQNRSIKK